MAIDTKKGKNVRLYILESDEPKLDRLCERTGLTITAALTMIINSGLKALESNSYRLTLPLRFNVLDTAVEDRLLLNESTPKPRHK